MDGRESNKKSKGKLFLSFVILILYIAIILAFIFGASFGEFSSITNYILLIIISLLFGFLYKWLQDGFNFSFEFRLKSSIITSSFLLSVFVLVIGIMNEITRVSAELLQQEGSELTPFISGVDVNLFLYSILFLLSFNLNYLIFLFREKEFVKYALYLIPILISQILVYVVISYLLPLFS